MTFLFLHCILVNWVNFFSQDKVLYSCEHCNCRRFSFDSFCRHLARHSKEEPSLRYSCIECGAKCKGARYWKRHVLSHRHRQRRCEPLLDAESNHLRSSEPELSASCSRSADGILHPVHPEACNVHEDVGLFLGQLRYAHNIPQSVVLELLELQSDWWVAV